VNRFNPSNWPIVGKVPLVVALLMSIVSAIVSNQVLTRMAQAQGEQLKQLASAYLDGLSSALTPAVLRQDVWEIFDQLDRSQSQYASLKVKWSLVAGQNDQVLAASDPIRFPIGSVVPTVTAQAAAPDQLSIDENNEVVRFSRELLFQERSIGLLVAEADVTELLAERQRVFWTLVWTNLLLTLGLAATGYFLVRRMIKPLRLLTDQFVAGQELGLKPLAETDVDGQTHEFRQLFNGYNKLVRAVAEREELSVKLAEEEKVASLGRLASGMAHEINNPLGGMFNALDAMRRHGDKPTVRETSIRLLDGGLSGIRDLVRSTLATYRSDQQLRTLTATDLDDLRLLVKPEAKRKKLHLKWEVETFENLNVPVSATRDAALNLLLNACAASEEGGLVGFHAHADQGELKLEISDTGPGLADHVREYIQRDGAGAVPLDRRSGLGLWIVKRLCDEMQASLSVGSTGPSGTTLKIAIPLNGASSQHAL